MCFTDLLNYGIERNSVMTVQKVCKDKEYSINTDYRYINTICFFINTSYIYKNIDCIYRI